MSVCPYSLISPKLVCTLNFFSIYVGKTKVLSLVYLSLLITQDKVTLYFSSIPFSLVTNSLCCIFFPIPFCNLKPKKKWFTAKHSLKNIKLLHITFLYRMWLLPLFVSISTQSSPHTKFPYFFLCVSHKT